MNAKREAGPSGPLLALGQTARLAGLVFARQDQACLLGGQLGHASASKVLELSGHHFCPVEKSSGVASQMSFHPNRSDTPQWPAGSGQMAFVLSGGCQEQRWRGRRKELASPQAQATSIKGRDDQLHGGNLLGPAAAAPRLAGWRRLVAPPPKAAATLRQRVLQAAGTTVGQPASTGNAPLRSRRVSQVWWELRHGQRRRAGMLAGAKAPCPTERVVGELTSPGQAGLG